MSRVYIRVIDGAGESETIGEVTNSSLFYVAVWGGLMKLHGIADGYTHNLRTLGKLWSRVATLPRHDALIVAATFDRCWFPIDMIGELEEALREQEDAVYVDDRS